MLIVDSNKRYSIVQVKQHKWMIQGEPYDDLIDIEDQHEEGSGVVYNEKVLQQMEKLGEDRVKIITVSLPLRLMTISPLSPCGKPSIESKILLHLHLNNSNSQISQSYWYWRNREIWA